MELGEGRGERRFEAGGTIVDVVEVEVDRCAVVVHPEPLRTKYAYQIL